MLYTGCSTNDAIPMRVSEEHVKILRKNEFHAYILAE